MSTAPVTFTSTFAVVDPVDRFDGEVGGTSPHLGEAV